MIKKLAIAVVAVIVVIAIIVLAAGVVVYLTVDKDFVETRMGEALNRQVYIESIDVGIFAAVSGIEVQGIAISNFKTPDQRARLQGTPVDPKDLFVGVESLRFTMRILPLLKRQFVLQELVLYNPHINLSKDRHGVWNIDDLTGTADPTAPEPREPRPREPSDPVSIDALPVALMVGEVGMRNGVIRYYDGTLDQTIQAYNVTALAHDIRIDPRDLAGKNEVKLFLDCGLKNIGAMKSGSIESFDVGVNATGRVIPFDSRTRLLDPEVLLRVNLPDGEMTGLEIFNALANIPLLGDYLGRYLSFLKGTQRWEASRESGLDLRYKGDEAEITNGRLDLREASVLFSGKTNLDTRAVAMDVSMAMSRQINDGVKESLANRIDRLITRPEVKRYLDSQELAAAAMQPLLGDEDRITITTAVGGTTHRPSVRLVQPQLESLSQVVRVAAESVLRDAAKDAATDAAREAIQDRLPDDQRQILDDLLRRRR